MVRAASFMIGASLIGLLTSQAEAQTAAPSATSPQAIEDQGAIGDIVVTAERRSESVQKSSLSIQVLSAKALENAGVAQARDLTKLAPGIQIGQGGPATQIYIRGVGDFGATAISNPAVAFNVDGIYVPRPQAIEGVFYDLQRIEVLKGPQGTLYGRNASGGAINVVTQKPTFDALHADVSLEGGNYGLIKANAAFNLPITDTFALRLAGEVVDRRGYTNQGSDDDKHQSIRLQGLWKPTDRLSIRLSSDYTHIGGQGPAYVFKGPLDPTIAAGVTALGVSIPDGRRVTSLDPAFQQLVYAVGRVQGLCAPNAALLTNTTAGGSAPIINAPQGFCPAGQSSLVAAPGNGLFPGQRAFQDNKFWNISAEISYDFDFATLTVLPSYRRARLDYTLPQLVTYRDSYFYPEKSDSYSLETRLAHDGERLKWVLGAYYFQEKQNAFSASDAGLILGLSQTLLKPSVDSYAGFGQLTYSLNPSWRLIAGARYSVDDKSFSGLNQSSAPGRPFLLGQPCYAKADPCVRDVFSGSKKFKSFTYKVGMEYDVGPQNMLFATYATGYKAGGFSGVSVIGTNNEALSYNPEKLRALELGSRNRFLNGRVQLNIEGFYWKYKDAQTLFATLNAAGNTVNAIANAGRATIYGADIELVVKPTRSDTLRLGGEFLHSNYDSFVYQTAGLIAGVTTGCTVTAVAPFQSVDCTGRPLARAPKYSATAGWTHAFDLGPTGSIETEISAQFVGSRYLTIDYIPATLAPSYVSGDATVTYTNRHGWSLSAFVRNFTDAKIYTGGFTAPTLLRSVVLANIGAPRTFGGRLSWHF